MRRCPRQAAAPCKRRSRPGARWGPSLGALEQKKAAALARGGAEPLSRQDIQAARNRWLKVVGRVLSNLDAIEGHEREIETLRGPVLRTAEAAAKRYAGKPSAAPAPELKKA